MLKVSPALQRGMDVLPRKDPSRVRPAEPLSRVMEELLRKTAFRKAASCSLGTMRWERWTSLSLIEAILWRRMV